MNNQGNAQNKELAKTFHKEYALSKLTFIRAKKDSFAESLARLQERNGEEDLQEMIKDALQKKGSVWGITNGKQYVAIWIFSVNENYFGEKVGKDMLENQDEKLDYDRTAKNLFKNRKSALVLTKELVLDDVLFAKDLYEEELLTKLKEKLSLEENNGIEFHDVLYHKRNVKMRKENKYFGVQSITGIAAYCAGFLFGMTVFNSVAMGACFGAMCLAVYAPMMFMAATREISAYQLKDGNQ